MMIQKGINGDTTMFQNEVASFYFILRNIKVKLKKRTHILNKRYK